jgi:O-glycosyl hydrolase
MFDYHEINHDPKVLVAKLPKEIVSELNAWVKECRVIKQHPLSVLREHDNIGTGHNSYQVSVPSPLIEDSYTLAYINRFCAECFGGGHREWRLRRWDGHYDAYDIMMPTICGPISHMKAMIIPPTGIQDLYRGSFI